MCPCFTQVVAVPMPLRDDPEITLGALRWVIDHVYRPNDIVHIVHVIKCLVQKLEVYHGGPLFPLWYLGVNRGAVCTASNASWLITDMYS